MSCHSRSSIQLLEFRHRLHYFYWLSSELHASWSSQEREKIGHNICLNLPYSDQPRKRCEFSKAPSESSMLCWRFIWVLGSTIKITKFPNLAHNVYVRCWEENGKNHIQTHNLGKIVDEENYWGNNSFGIFRALHSDKYSHHLRIDSIRDGPRLLLYIASWIGIFSAVFT